MSQDAPARRRFDDHPRTSEGQPVTQAEFYRVMRELEASITAAAIVADNRAIGRFEELMSAAHRRFDTVDRKLDDQGQRLLTVEIERRDEKASITKRGTLFGVMGGAALSGLIRLLEHWFKP